MLDISRIGTGKLSMNRATVDLAELAREVVERMQPQLSAASCRLEIETDVGITGRWDRYRIEQVICNLLTNAIRYAPGKPIHVTVAAAGPLAVLRVRDEGQGIEPGSHERIFQRFERAVASSSISGLGLGLYICREIMTAHEGRIRVESALGQGATFIVELPRLQA
jgi:signal transduction histidine kinase